MKKGIPYFTLTILMLMLLFLPVLSGDNLFFGSEGDWYSQHVGAAENIRQMILETGTFFPQYSAAGGGSNIYDFAYYGLYRPDVLFSCLVPNLEMKYIVAGYAVLLAVGGVNLCYLWLRKKGLTRPFAMAAALLFSAASCFYHEHHQIMFVNYLPFLILALMGIDLFLQKKKSWLMVSALFLIYLHSYFYAFSCLVVCFLYYIWQISSQENMTLKQAVKTTGHAAAAVFISIGLAGVLLIPTAVDILSTEKDAGGFMTEGLASVDLTFGGLLYQPYGCGMTLLALYLLVLSLTKKKWRGLSAAILLIFLLPIVAYVLNGFLYARSKILIPFLPLVVLICGFTLQDLWRGKQKRLFWPILVCLLPLITTKWQTLMVIEVIILVGWLLLQRGTTVDRRLKAACLALVLIIPVGVSLGINIYGENYIKADDSRQSHFTFGDIHLFASDRRYRFDYLSNNYVNSNLVPEGRLFKTAMYSSVTSSDYARFYYDTMRNPISFRNRVALMPNKNPYFNYFMGIRYLLADEEKAPEGYKTVFVRKGHVLAENEEVLPLAYGTIDLMSQENFEKLDFPQNMEALTKRAVVRGSGSAPSWHGTTKEINPEKDLNKVLSNNGKGRNLEIPLNVDLTGKALVLTFHVESPKGHQVEITINGMKNNLSSKTAPYPNNNHDFTFVLNENNLKTLKIKLSKGVYDVNQVKLYTIDLPRLQERNIVLPTMEEEMGRDGQTMFKGTIDMDKTGYFITSFPYKKGYRVTVDGNNVEPEKVNTAFLGFPIEKGNHRIEIKFVAPGFSVGKILSLLSLMVYMGLMMIERKNKKWNE